jgi:hypothetical protein
MIIVRVFLSCASHTNRPSGTFDTFVAVTRAAFEAGRHITIAERRAAILGFEGPYRITEVRQLGETTDPAPEQSESPRPQRRREGEHGNVSHRSVHPRPEPSLPVRQRRSRR